MRLSKLTVLALGIVSIGLFTGLGRPASAQPSQDVIGQLANDEGLFVDGKTFNIARGKAKGDPAAQIAKLGAKEVGPGAIIFRYGDKLYMVEGTPEAAPHAMKNFQDNWAVSYMKSMKDFQDNWAVSYIKNFQDNWNVSYMKGDDAKYAQAMKNFQDNWNVSYMKNFQDNWNVSYMKDFQDNWNVSYMKNFQDNWNVSYMKNFQDNWNVSFMKDFQDNWNVSYMKKLNDFQDNWNISYMKEAKLGDADMQKIKSSGGSVQDGPDEGLPGQLERVLHEGAEGFPGQLERLLYEGLPGQLERVLHEVGEGLPGQLEHVLHEVRPSA